MPNLMKKLLIYFKKTGITSRDGLQSNASEISCVIASSLFTQESDEQKAD